MGAHDFLRKMAIGPVGIVSPLLSIASHDLTGEARAGRMYDPE
jgi:hypothetical protein